MQIVLFDTQYRSGFFPLTQTRAIADLRFGLLTIKQRWQQFITSDISVLAPSHLAHLYPVISPGTYIFVDSTILPDTKLIESLSHLKPGQSLLNEEYGFIAAHLETETYPSFDSDFSLAQEEKISIEKVRKLSSIFEMCQWNKEMISEDFERAIVGKHCVNNYETVQFVNSPKIFIDEGAQISFSILNATDGPIYIGKNSTIMEGCLIRGPFALGENAVLKMGTKIYGATSIGPNCVIGGEIKNSIIMSNSNKAHDGYLGDSVIGEWCNLGAGTTNSNLKNTGGLVKVWSSLHNKYIECGTKAGVIMGDYSQTAINTSINTGTVIGVCCNVFGNGLTPKHIPDFSWGSDGECRYELQKAFKSIENWKAFKGQQLSDGEKNMLEHIFNENRSGLDASITPQSLN